MLIFMSVVSTVQSLDIVPKLKPTIRPFQTRRALLQSATAAAAIIHPNLATAASPTVAETSSSQSIPRPTALVALDLTINRSLTTRPLRIELFGDDNGAPESVSFFTDLSSGKLRAACDPNAPTSETCLEYQNQDVGYINSQVWRLVPDRRIDFGRVDSIFSARVPPTIPPERRTTSSGAITPSTRGA